MRRLGRFQRSSIERVGSVGCGRQADAQAAIGFLDRNFEAPGFAAVVIEVDLGLCGQQPAYRLGNDRPNSISYLHLGERCRGDVISSCWSKQPRSLTHFKAKLFSLLMVEDY